MGEHSSLSTTFKTVVLLRNEQPLGKGAYGKVFRAKCDKSTICAAKLIHETIVDPQQASTPASPYQRFIKECDVLNKLRHPNIVQYLGIHIDSHTNLPILLMELMDTNLTIFLQCSIHHHIRVNICHDITLALSYLHMHKITHRDLSANNVLMIGNRAKLSDFGMVKLVAQNCPAASCHNTVCPGTKEYMPPEARRDNAVYTEKIDCFSFGVVVIQVLTCMYPSPGNERRSLGNGTEEIIPEKERRQHEIDTIEPHNPLLSIALDCIRDNEDERPSSPELCERVELLKNKPEYAQSMAAPVASQPPTENRQHEVNQRINAENRDIRHLERVQKHNKCKKIICKSWGCMILTAIGALVLAYLVQHLQTGNIPSGPINTPLRAPLCNEGGWRNKSLDEQRLWGSYRSNIYFGMRPRIARSLMFGMMWSVYNEQHTWRTTFKHVCKHDDVLNYGWLRHDGTSFGQQKIIDTNITITTDFITTSTGWTANIISNYIETSPRVWVSFIFYIYNEGEGKIGFNPGNKNFDAFISGYTSEFENFVLQFQPQHADRAAKFHHLSAYQPEITHLRDYIESIFNATLYEGRGFIHLPGSLGSDVPNLIAYQITCTLPMELNIIFEAGHPHKHYFGDHFTNILLERIKVFDAKFEAVFHLRQKKANALQIAFAQATFSNLIGSISYSYGTSKVTSKDMDEAMDYWPAPLYTGIPSRSFFPRGFLWDEGFHQLVLVHWDTSIVKDVLAHWLDLMNNDGWIPREQILGDEARSKVPANFLVQSDEIANPPTFFLTLKSMIIQMTKENTMDYLFLKSIYPRLEALFNWFNEKQSGSIPHTYRWRGRDENTDRELNPKTHASGFDDYPRASHPTIDERHVDLRCWMALASEVMTNISDILGYYFKAMHYRVHYHSLSNQISLDELHWDPERKQYSDYGLHTSSVELVRESNKTRHLKRNVTGNPTKSYVNSFGYVSLFPFLLKLISPNSEKLGYILKKMGDEDLLWTDFGLRSLSKDDPFYNKANTKDDPPYWRGSIWINMNYLACRALYHYGITDGVHKNDAASLYQKLRFNLIRNVHTEYERTGYVWESYDDTTGYGKGTHPYTGWSSLIILIMAEKYD